MFEVAEFPGRPAITATKTQLQRFSSLFYILKTTISILQNNTTENIHFTVAERLLRSVVFILKCIYMICRTTIFCVKHLFSFHSFHILNYPVLCNIKNSKLIESCKAVKLQLKKIPAGEIFVSDNTSTVWESSPVFVGHKLDNYRIEFNRIKAEGDKGEGGVSLLFQNYLFFITFDK